MIVRVPMSQRLRVCLYFVGPPSAHLSAGCLVAKQPTGMLSGLLPRGEMPSLDSMSRSWLWEKAEGEKRKRTTYSETRISDY